MCIHNFRSTLFSWSILLCFAFLFAGCSDDLDPVVPLETSSVVDHEGNVYQTVKIGNQWWMAEDLKVTSFRSGLSIDEVVENEAWANTDEPAYTTFQNQDVALVPGILYNYHVVNSNEEIAPEGWHIPSDAEWKELEQFLGMSASQQDEVNWRGTDQGDKLKVAATEGWLFYEEVWANNESGFSAFGGSSRFFQGPFGVPGLKGSGFWWTSTDEQGYGWYRYLDYKKSGIFRHFGHPNYGFSIRCVKD